MKRKVPVVLQAGQAECGLGAAASVLQFFGRHQTVSDLRRLAEPGREGLTLRQVRDVLTRQGMDVTAYRVNDIERLKGVKTPVILHWMDSHYVVLDRIRRDRVRVMDPAQGFQGFTVAEANARVSGGCLIATPSPEFRRVRRDLARDWRMREVFTNRMISTYVVFFMLLAASYASTFAIPLAVERIIDAQMRSDRPAIVKITGLLLAGIMVYWSVCALRALVLAKIVADIGTRLLGDLFAKLLRLPLSYFTLRSPGDILYRLASANALKDFLSSNATEFLINIGTAGVVLVFLGQRSLEVMGIALTMVLTLCLVWRVTAPSTSRLMDAELAQASDAQVVQLDAISTIATLKMGDAEERTVHTWKAAYTRSMQFMKRRVFIQQGILGSAASALQLYGPVILFLASLPLVDNERLSLGQAVAMEGISALLFSSVSSAIYGVMGVTAVDRSVARMVDIDRFDRESNNGEVKTLAGTDVAVQDLCFAYPGGRNPVLQDVSFSVPAGEDIAIVGESGSGKSTLAMVICSLYQPTSGEIFFGGLSYDEYSLRDLRAAIGYVPQQLPTKTGTLYENITAGLREERPRAEVEREIKEMGILSFVDELPLKFDTLVSSGGTTFSGGQLQRVSIAAALLRRPRVLVLDEATSSLDTVTEARVTKLFGELQCTRIVVAHRLTTVRHCHQIVVLDRGRIVQIGSHRQLMCAPGKYRELYFKEDRGTRGLLA